METTEIILIIISTLMLAEGMIVSIFPKQIIKATKQILKKEKNLVKLGLIEIIFALLLLVIISL